MRSLAECGTVICARNSWLASPLSIRLLRQFGLARSAGSILLALGVKPEDVIGISEFATFATGDTEAMMNGSWLYSSRHGLEEDDNDPLDGMTITPSLMINARVRNALDGPDVVGS